MNSPDQVWRTAAVVQRYLEGVRGGIPLAAEPIRILLHLVEAAVPDVGSFVDALCELHARIGVGKPREQIERQYYQRADKAANILAPVDQCRWLREIGFGDVDC